MINIEFDETKTKGYLYAILDEEGWKAKKDWEGDIAMVFHNLLSYNPELLSTVKMVIEVMEEMNHKDGPLMRRVSDKQRRINSELAQLKLGMGTRCRICGREGHDLSHILPRSLYPEYVTDPRNLQILCRDCHRRFDDDREFRRRQTDIVQQAIQIDECAANRYFGL